MTTALVTIPPSEALRALVITPEETELACAAIAHVASLGPILDNGMAIEYGQLLEEIHALRAQIEERRKAVKAPVLALGKAIDAAGRESLGACEQAMQVLKDKRTVWAAKCAQLARQAEAEAKKEAAVEGRATPAITAPVVQAAEACKLVKTRAYHSLRIVDDSQIPREFLKPDEAKILEVLKAGVAVPGCELVTEKKAVR